MRNKYSQFLIFQFFLFAPFSFRAQEIWVSGKSPLLLMAYHPDHYFGTNDWDRSLMSVGRTGQQGKESWKTVLKLLMAERVNNLGIMAGAEGACFKTVIERSAPPLHSELEKSNLSVFETLIQVPTKDLNVKNKTIADILPIDKQATKETVNLYNNLKKLTKKGIMFGHQDDLAYGVNWKYVPGKSDIKEVTGDYPAVYGWELGHLELDSAVNLDSVPFDKMKHFIRQAYDRGGVVTISWHLRNPLTGKTSWDPAPGTVASILPGGEKHNLYKSWLDKVSAFVSDLKGKKGEAIPIIFRPFHELNGNWFWWGKNHCTPDELKELYQFTVTYLRDQKKLHNLLYAFNTDRFTSEEEYLERYPGDEWVDVIGFDVYQRGKGTAANEQFVKDVDKMLATLVQLAQQKNKIPAMTEFGFGGLPDSTWWSTTFSKTIQPHKISYVLAWRNAGRKENGSSEYYVPYKGHSSEKDFKDFYKLKNTLFQKEVTREKLYGSK